MVEIFLDYFNCHDDRTVKMDGWLTENAIGSYTRTHKYHGDVYVFELEEDGTFFKLVWS